MTRLWAGPYIGEFGWELFYWQGWLRKYSKSFDEVYVACRSGRELLYEDFATKVIPYEGISEITDCEKAMGFSYDNRHEQYGVFNEIILPWEKAYFRPEPEEQEFVELGRPCTSYLPDRWPIVLHARDTNKYNTSYRDWSHEKWDVLNARLSKDYYTQFIGTEKSSYCPHLADEDCRGLDLEKTCMILASSLLIAGPSSGPIHLASLCSVPQVVWTGPHKNVIRYQKEWNPFNTPVNVIEPLPGAAWNDPRGWDADLDEVEAAIREMAEMSNDERIAKYASYS